MIKFHSNNPQDIVNFIIVLVLINLIIFFWRKFNFKNKKYVRKQIEALDSSIAKQDKLTAYGAYKFLIESFNLQTSNSTIKDLGRNAIRVEWDYLREEFVNILNKYKAINSADRDMSTHDIDVLIDKNSSLIEKTDEFKCLECGAIIPINENKCAKCGWSWKDK